MASKFAKRVASQMRASNESNRETNWIQGKQSSKVIKESPKVRLQGHGDYGRGRRIISKLTQICTRIPHEIDGERKRRGTRTITERERERERETQSERRTREHTHLPCPGTSSPCTHRTAQRICSCSGAHSHRSPRIASVSVDTFPPSAHSGPERQRTPHRALARDLL